MVYAKTNRMISVNIEELPSIGQVDERTYFMLLGKCTPQLKVRQVHSMITGTDRSVEQDSHIYVNEEGAWAMKGRFSRAVNIREQLPWQRDDKGKLVLSVLAVWFYSFHLHLTHTAFRT